MKRRPILVLSAIVVLALTLELGAQRGGFGMRDVAPDGSRVEYKTFQSKLLNREIRYGLYLPPSYASSPTKKYPVLYFLHGLNENEMRWSSRGMTDLKLDKMVADGKIGEFIVAVPFGATGFYTNFRNGSQPWEDMVVTEFIPMIESANRVNATRATRGISGISMGGYGSLKIAMKHPELFGSVSAHSPVLLANLNDARIAGLSCLCADFTDHAYAPHSHDALVVAVTEAGGSEFRSRGEAHEAAASALLVFNPAEPHSGRMARSRRWRYRGLYLDGAALATAGLSRCLGATGACPGNALPRRRRPLSLTPPDQDKREER